MGIQRAKVEHRSDATITPAPRLRPVDLDREAPAELPAKLVTVYLLYRRDRTLLYVGITGTRSLTRFGQHRASKPWWPEVHSIELEHFPRAHLARLRETELIRTRRPLYNDRSSARPRPYYRPR